MTRKRITRRALAGLVVSAFATAGLAIPESFAKHFLGNGGAKSGTAPGVLTTLTLVNTSGSTQASGFVTPIFGHSFAKGDIPTGTAPQFQISGVNQSYSWGCQSYWSDSSLRHASFMFRSTASVAGNGTLSVNVMSGGTAPSTSARTLTEVHAQSIVMVGVGAGSNFGLSGTWSSWLNGDANEVEAFVYLDGDAGKVWRTKNHFALTVGGTAHGQLECYHYIAALTDSSGNLGGFRYIGRMAQPYYNLDTPTKNWRGFTSVSWQHGAGPTTVGLVWPYTAATFTSQFNTFTGSSSGGTLTVSAVGSGAALAAGDILTGTDGTNSITGNVILSQLTGTPGGVGTYSMNNTASPGNMASSSCSVTNTQYPTSTNNFYSGTTTNGAQNMVPGILSTTGTLPAPLTTTQIYYATTVNAGTAFINLSVDSTSTAPLIKPTTFGSGTHTFTPIPTCLHFGSLYTADSSGKVQFFQGTGSMTADGTIRTQYNQVYAIKTHVLPPWNTSYTGVTYGGTIKDVSFAYNWTPVSSGPIGMASRGNAGGSPDIGWVPIYHVQHFYNQSATADLVVRITAFASDFEGVGNFRDVTTGQYPNYGTGTYTGCPAPSSGQQGMEAINDTYVGFTAPANGGYFNIGERNLSHKYRMCFMAAWAFAEPHFIDLLLEAGIGGILETNVLFRNPPSSGGFTGSPPTGTGVFAACGGGGVRAMAWANMDLQMAAMLAPLNHPDGTQICNYIRDMADTNANYPNLVMNATQLGTYLNTNKSWRPVYQPATLLESSGYGFMGNYFHGSMCMAAARENANALTWLNTVSAWPAHMLSAFGGYHLYVEFDHGVLLDSIGSDLAGVADDAHYGVITAGNIDFLRWTTTGATKFSIDNVFRGYVVTAGDKYLFDPGEPIPGNFSADTPYYVRDVSGNAFNLAATNGGTAITPSNAGSIQTASGPGEGLSGPFFIMAAPPAASTGNSPSSLGPDSYLTEFLMVYNWAIALGSTGWSGVQSDANTRAVANGFDYTGSPGFLSQNTFG